MDFVIEAIEEGREAAEERRRGSREVRSYRRSPAKLETHVEEAQPSADERAD